MAQESPARPWSEFERRLLRVVQAGRTRCSLGYGKYPWGVLDAVEELMPLVDADSPARAEIEQAVAEFKKRLDE